jgi:sterol desaturase/sphingolipid hydroxylase (fatty acid hydroxylase superfamily)
MTYNMKPLSCDSARIKGMSERLIISHYENNYGGAVKRLNLIEQKLDELDYANAAGFLINGLKREQLIAMNSMILHELFFDGLGEESEPGCRRSRGAETRGWGLFNLMAVPAWVGVVSSVVVLDLAIYLQHVLFHAVPVLWRLHRMHHADLEFDVSTGLRFHPLEILLSMLIKFTVIVALGAPAVAVLIFEVLLNATSMFNHGNVRIPTSLDRTLRWIVVTPDMHRVHHSILSRETNSNFGFNLPWWDRLFGTYWAQPTAGHDGMTIGIEQFREPRELGLDRMLLQPFRGDAGRYPLGRPEGEQ